MQIYGEYVMVCCMLFWISLAYIAVSDNIGEVYIPYYVTIFDMNDVATLLSAIRKFRDDRNWWQFHNPKDLAIALNIETSELLEQFLWKQGGEITDIVEQQHDKIADEVADVFIYLLQFADMCDIDLLDAAFHKVAKNNEKYPIDKSVNTHKKYSDL